MNQLLKDKKILIVCNSSFAYKYFLIPLTNELNSKGAKINLLIGKDEKNYSLNIIKFKTFFVRMPRRSINHILDFFYTIFKIRKILKNNNYDYIISNNRDASFCSRLALFFYGPKKPKSIYLARGFYFNDSQNYFFWFFSYIIELLLLSQTNLILSQSNEDLNRTSFFLNLFKIRYFWIGNGVNFNKFFFDNKVKDKKYINFVTTCRITKGKGLEDLFFSFNKLLIKYANIRLTIIGGPISSDDKKYYEKLKINFNFKNIFITGIIDDVVSILQSSDFYIHPSYREGVPRSLIEAMSTGLVVLATNIRGAREIIIHEINGYLYLSKNRNDLYKNIEFFINMGEDTKNFIIKNSLKTVEEYDEKKYLNRQINGILNIL